MVEYATVKIPTSFRDRFGVINDKHDLGYASLAEFVKEAMRKRFEEIEAAYREKQ